MYDPAWCRLGEAFVKTGACNQLIVSRALAKHWGLPFANLSKGEIGKAGFAHLVNDGRFAGVPMILETPKGKDGRGADLDKVNLNRLRRLVRA